MLKSFQEYIARQRLCKTTDKILLAVSGGIDSMVMLHLFVTSGYKIGVAHCNFQLRGQESDKDELFVKQTCDQFQIPFHSTRFNTNNYAVERGLSTQMAARDLRYSWFEEILKKENFDLLATAHHLNDSVETVLLNLVHGRGVDGLTGIAEKSKYIIRPMLFALRDDIVRYAEAESIAWREDASNQTDDYKRNEIRHRVISVLKEINSNLEFTVQRSMDKNKGVAELLKLGVETFESKYVKKTETRVEIDKESLRSFHYASSVLYELIKKYHFSLEQCAAICNSLAGQSGKVFFTATHQLVVDRTEIIINKLAKPLEEVLIYEGQSKMRSGTLQLEMNEMQDGLVLKDKLQVMVDADKIQYPITWRPWREGDLFYPLGMDHKKKISDFLIDRKVALSDKDQVTVLESSGEIFWVVGYQISNRFKMTPDTKKALRFTVSPHFT